MTPRALVALSGQHKRTQGAGSGEPERGSVGDLMVLSAMPVKG
jgi:hypothetical protein